MNISDEEIKRKSYFKLIHDGHLVIDPPEYTPKHSDGFYGFKLNIIKKRMKYLKQSKYFN